MNDTELFDLCKEVYKRTGWYEPGILLGHTERTDKDRRGVWSPIYTSDYLLEKLKGIVGSFNLCPQAKGDWVLLANANFEEKGYYADSPLKALLKLVIALDDAKELK